MEHVKDILALEGHKDHICVDQKGFAYDALQLLSKSDTGCILVLEDKKLVGLFTERSYARKVLIKGLSSWKSVISEIMRTDYPIATLEMNMEECLELLSVHSVQHLPVMSSDKILGVISIDDVDQSHMRDQETKIKLLEDYVYSRRS